VDGAPVGETVCGLFGIESVAGKQFTPQADLRDVATKGHIETVADNMDVVQIGQGCVVGKAVRCGYWALSSQSTVGTTLRLQACRYVPLATRCFATHSSLQRGLIRAGD
jgi:putative heme iron utilization protein